MTIFQKLHNWSVNNLGENTTRFLHSSVITFTSSILAAIAMDIESGKALTAIFSLAGFAALLDTGLRAIIKHMYERTVTKNIK